MTAHFCSTCRETAEPDIEYSKDGLTVERFCSYCGSDRILASSDLIDMAEYRKGGR